MGSDKTQTKSRSHLNILYLLIENENIIYQAFSCYLFRNAALGKRQAYTGLLGIYSGWAIREARC